MARLDEIEPFPSGPASQGPVRPSIWSAIHPKLLELVRAHRSTIIFVNNRRLAERIAGAVNDLAGEIAGSRASRQRGRRAAQRDRRSAEDGNPAGTGGDLVARTRHRHGSSRSGGSDRSAALGRQRHAAHRARQPSCRSSQQGHDLSQVPRRPAGLRGGHPRHVRRHRSSRCASRAIRSTCWRSRSSPWSRWTSGRWTICSQSCAGQHPMRG